MDREQRSDKGTLGLCEESSSRRVYCGVGVMGGIAAVARILARAETMITFFLTRERFGETYTIGRLKTPLQTFYTLEDKVREESGVPVCEWKIPGETAIPVGTYPLIIDMSNRFKKLMPHICNVDGFEGIRIHAGNTSEDTEGCVLLGWAVDKEGSAILQSRDAVTDFMQELESYYDQNAPVQIQIT